MSGALTLQCNKTKFCQVLQSCVMLLLSSCSVSVHSHTWSSLCIMFLFVTPCEAQLLRQAAEGSSILQWSCCSIGCITCISTVTLHDDVTHSWYCSDTRFVVTVKALVSWHVVVVPPVWSPLSHTCSVMLFIITLGALSVCLLLKKVNTCSPGAFCVPACLWNKSSHFILICMLSWDETNWELQMLKHCLHAVN